jgi:hypothetical protein
MSFLSHYCRNKLLGLLMGMDTFPSPQLFIGFSSQAPVDDTIQEPVNADYNRLLYTHWKISHNRIVANNTTIVAYTRSDWGTLRYFLIWDAPTQGNLIGYGALDTPVAAGANKVLSFSKGKLQLRIEPGTATDYLSNRFLEHLFGHITLSSIHSYVGLSYTNPTDAGSPVTPVDTDYSDVPFLGWGITEASELVNVTPVTFTPRSDWGTLPYMFIRDAENRVLFYSAFVQPVVGNQYSPVIFEVGDLGIVFD